MAKLFHLFGKSCSGKDTVYCKVLEHYKWDKSFKPIIPYTTRPMREGEVQGVAYNFLTNDEMRHILDHRGDDYGVVEYRVYNTEYGEWIYATILNKDILYDIKNSIPNMYAIIGTVETLDPLIELFGVENVLPVYLEATPNTLLLRAMDRIIDKESVKVHLEACRRFIKDEEDFNSFSLKKYLNENNTVTSSDDVVQTVADVVDVIVKFKGG